ncbi:MAG: DNA primase DnaG [Promethearchaeia archaeon]
MRDLQKSGRIGRIEVENKSKGGISQGTIKIPSSLTRRETALLAATVETVTRVGPCEAEIKLEEIRDVRETKRKKIISRAAELLKEWDQKSLDKSEIEEKIDEDIKLGEIITWGPEDLPAGPEINESKEIIIVEGRADVLNLLRIGVKNSVAVQGTHIPESIKKLMKKSKPKRTITAFLDGDRGGTLILKEVMQVGRLDYVARAPEGYEVEELTRKQMIKELQNKQPVEEIGKLPEDISAEEKEKPVREKRELSKLEKLLIDLNAGDPSIIVKAIEDIEPGMAKGFDYNLEELFSMKVRELFEEIRNYEKTKFLIFYGILSERLLSLTLNLDVEFIACKNKEEDLKIPRHIHVHFF